MRNLYVKNYKGQLKRNQNKWKGIPCSWIGRLAMMILILPFKGIYWLNTDSLEKQNQNLHLHESARGLLAMCCEAEIFFSRRLEMEHFRHLSDLITRAPVNKKGADHFFLASLLLNCILSTLPDVTKSSHRSCSSIQEDTNYLISEQCLVPPS